MNEGAELTEPAHHDNALVLEGGGYRGIFTAGVLDVLQERGVYGFSSVWGVSAGAINAASFKSRQIGRTMRIMLAFRDDRRFMSLWSLVRTGDIAGADFMYDEIQYRLDPSDNAAFNENPLRMYAVATDVVFGTAAYLPVHSFPDDVTCVRASASLPLVSRTVEIGGHRYLDGGTADSIPFEAALGLPVPRGAAPGASPEVRAGLEASLHATGVVWPAEDAAGNLPDQARKPVAPELGEVMATGHARQHLSALGNASPQVEGHTPAERALVVLTRERTFLRDGRSERLALRSHRYDAFPYYVDSLVTRAARYNACRERLFALEAAPSSRVLVVAPERPVDIGVTERDGGRLLDLYLQGRQQAERRIDEIRAFLSAE